MSENADIETRARWPAMESNPGVLNSFAYKLGLNTEQWNFCDVWGLDDDLLAFIPQPTLSLILLFPSSSKVAQPDNCDDNIAKILGKAFFLKQVSQLDDACGTIAVVHSIANNADILGLGDDSILRQFINDVKDKTIEEKGKALANNIAISNLHASYSKEGSTSSVEIGKSNHHFVCFTNIDGRLVELDGVKPLPTDHGSIDDSTFLKAACTAIKKTYITSPDVVDFSIIALTSKSE